MTLVLVDTSVWARSRDAEIGAKVADAISANAVVLTAPIVIELLTSARSAEELRSLAGRYDALHAVAIDDRVTSRAREIQAELAGVGHHRGPSVTDLLSSAAAELVGATVWHCDKRYDQIAAVTDQPAERICD